MFVAMPQAQIILWGTEPDIETSADRSAADPVVAMRALRTLDCSGRQSGGQLPALAWLAHHGRDPGSADDADLHRH